MLPRDEALARLKSAAWLPVIAPFFRALDGEAGTTRAVGGIVRDTLLGIARTGTDFDLATRLAPAEVMARAEQAGLAAHPTGFEHGTVTLVADEVVAEVTTLREDVETFGRRAKVRFGTDWSADARRRDFTMNALYCGPSGVLFDPLDGLDDCLLGRVRFIGDADQRIAEDKLRVYRYFRFSASHGEQRYETEALAACERAAGALETLSAERVGAEMTRLLGLPRCAQTLAVMEDIGVLSKALFPDEVIAALGRLEMLGLPVTASMRLAIVQSLTEAIEPLRIKWRLSNRDMAEIETLGRAAQLAEQERWMELAYRFSGHWRDAVTIAAAIGGKSADWIRASGDGIESIGAIDFPVSGNDLLERGLSGPELGAQLRRLETIWIAAGGKLDKAALLARVSL